MSNSIRPMGIRTTTNTKLWTNVFKDEPAFIVGNGPSAEDVTKDQWDIIRKYFTIGINRAFLLIDPVVLFWQDAQLWETERANVVKLNSIKVCRDSVDLQRRFLHFNLRNSEYRLPSSPNILYGRGSTGPLAFQFTYALGCNPIILIGFDCKYRNAKTDFYGVNPYHQKHTMAMCQRGLQWIAKSESGRKIYNCSDNIVFEKRDNLETVLKEIPSSSSKQEDFLIRLRNVSVK